MEAYHPCVAYSGPVVSSFFGLFLFVSRGGSFPVLLLVVACGAGSVVTASVSSVGWRVVGEGNVVDLGCSMWGGSLCVS